MTLHHGLFVAGATGGVTSAKDARLALAALLSGAGVISGGAVSGNSSGPNMKYDLAAGQFVTARGSAATDGLYVFVNDGTITVDSAAPAPVSGTRWDLIWVRHKNAIDGFADDASDPILGVTVGTSGSSPTKPYGSVPAGALVLAESQVHTGDADATHATITQVAAQVASPLPRAGDVEWTDVAATSGWTSNLQVRKRNGQIQFSGSITKNTGNLSNTVAVQIASLPGLTFAPKALFRALMFGYLGTSGAQAGAFIEIAAGATAINMTWNQVGSFAAVYFDGFSYPAAS